MFAVQYVTESALPVGHAWMIVQRGGTTTALVIDRAAERVARAVYSNSRKSPREENASSSLSISAD